MLGNHQGIGRVLLGLSLSRGLGLHHEISSRHVFIQLRILSLAASRLVNAIFVSEISFTSRIRREFKTPSDRY